ncbi:MAG TPA: DUF2780 domain-containing protein [Gammaproteobacteria bacterium]|nr:DUF2780 domain-containing protein [Gammaproteobacteria bacterium]
MFKPYSMRLRALLVVLSAGLGGLWSSAAPAAGLSELLVGKLGVSQPQAVGGAGSIFQLAKNQMTAGNFAKLSNAVPDMSSYLAAAPALGTAAPSSGTGALASAAAKALGGSGALDGATALGGTSALGGEAAAGVGGKLATLQQLAPAFEQLGMKQKLIGKFVPVIVDYVKQQGGASTAQLLSGALGF